MKSFNTDREALIIGRSPHGERGLKYESTDEYLIDNESLPPRGAWIEMSMSPKEFKSRTVAPPTGSVD